ncbi:hypothetical protein GE278_09045 [Enterobacteriaceae bacterium Kacie_13]|nr:hypothetical protein GE278_09045 [Enterobacteriaceae bacterium Kacie_13]
MKQDWHQADIIAAIKKKGTTLFRPKNPPWRAQKSC